MEEQPDLRRKLPPCPNTTDPTLHETWQFSDDPTHNRYLTQLPDGRWVLKSYWFIWTAAPMAGIVDSVDAWGSMCSPDDMEEWERDIAIDTDYGVQLVLQSKDDQDVLQCSTCKHEFTCDQDMNLHPINADEGNSQWRIM